MKRLLSSTTAFSVALATINPGFAFAQTKIEVDGQQVMCFAKAGKDCPDGATCYVIPEGPCTKKAVKAAKGGADTGAKGEAGKGEAGTDAAIAAEAKAARKAAKAAEQAAANDAAAAEAKAARKAAKAAEQAGAAKPAEDTEADAKAARKAAKAAEQAAADEAAAAEAKAARKAAKAAEQAAAEEAAAAEAKAARKAAKAAEAAEAAKPMAEDSAEVKAARKAAKAAEEAAAAKPDDAALAAAAKSARAAAKAATAAMGTAQPAAGDEKPRRKKRADPLPLVQSAEGVTAPKAEAVTALTDILTAPEEDAAATTTDAPAATAGEATPKPAKKRKKPKAADVVTTADPAKDAVVTVVGKGDARRSDEDFATAAVTSDAEAEVADKKRSKMSDLEKFGLVVLGGLVVGALLKNGDEVVSNTGDRVVVQRDDGSMTLLKDDDTLIRQPGSTVSTESYDDGSTRTIVARADGTKIMTIRDASGRVLRRARINLDGSQTLLIDDLAPVQEVNVKTLPKPRNLVVSTANENAGLQAALLAEQSKGLGRSFSLRQIRDYREVRALAPMVDVESVTFASGSAAIAPSEARKLAALGRLMSDLIAANPAEMFLIEGHTDAVGGAAYNLALSDRRAESLALALTEYFDVPAENMVIEGYGEGELRIATQADEALNRRAVVRLISPLLSSLSAQAE